MKLNLLPARTGWTWVQAGLRTFFKQPLAMGGLFFMFFAAVTVASALPVVGAFLGLVPVPALILGLMVASEQADRGVFPMPSALGAALTQGKVKRLHMLQLGAIYAVGAALAVLASSVVDDGLLAKFYFQGGKLTPEIVRDSNITGAALLFFALWLPLSACLWHAPALVHFHGAPPCFSVWWLVGATKLRTWSTCCLGWLCCLACPRSWAWLLAPLAWNSSQA
jgi:hypothetical protein